MPGDPYFSDVVLLTHCDGTAGQSTFTDTSPRAGAISQVGTSPNFAVVQTSAPKFGTGAVDFTAHSGAQLQVSGPDSDFDFLTGDFTIETWAYAVSSPFTGALIARFSSDGWYFGFIFGNLAFWFLDATSGLTTWTTAGVITTGGWHHLAVDRAGSTLRLYYDGAVVGTHANTAFSAAAHPLQMGGDATGARPWPGYMDDVRITVGVARYAGAFTPPTAPFPDTGGSPPAGNPASGMFFG